MNSCFLMCLGYLPISDAWSWQSEGTWQVPAVPAISTPVQVTSSLVCCCAAAETACPAFSPPVDGDVQWLWNPCSPPRRVSVSLHHCLTVDKKGAWIPLLLLSWLSWEWISVSFTICLLVKKVGTFAFPSIFTCSFSRLSRLVIFSSSCGMSWIWMGSSVKLGLWTEAGWRKTEKWRLLTGNKKTPALILGVCVNEIGNTYFGLIAENMLLCPWASGIKALLSRGTENWQTWSVLPIKVEDITLSLAGH